MENFTDSVRRIFEENYGKRLRDELNKIHVDVDMRRITEESMYTGWLMAWDYLAPLMDKIKVLEEEVERLKVMRDE